MKKEKKTTVRFDLNKAYELRAYEQLINGAKRDNLSQNAFIIKAINDYGSSLSNKDADKLTFDEKTLDRLSELIIHKMESKNVVIQNSSNNSSEDIDALSNDIFDNDGIADAGILDMMNSFCGGNMTAN